MSDHRCKIHDTTQCDCINIESNQKRVIDIDIEYYEYDCGRPCTVDGCLGHVTDIPISITIDDVTFCIEDADDNFAGYTKEQFEHVKTVVNKLYDITKRL